MKVRPSIKARCEHCKIIKRRGVTRIICKNPRHKARQGEAPGGGGAPLPGPPPQEGLGGQSPRSERGAPAKPALEKGRNGERPMREGRGGGEPTAQRGG